MNIYALELDNDRKGIAARKQTIESLLARLERPDLVVLPELALCSYLGNETLWQYADDAGKDTAAWARAMAEKYDTFLGVGYLEKSGGEYYNSYLLAGKERVYGNVRKSEGEAYLFKRGSFPNLVSMPFGDVAVAICYDARRKHFYDEVRDRAVSLILFPHGAPSDPRKAAAEQAVVDGFCGAYAMTFGVPVVYVNSRGKLDPMLGRTGKLMAKAGFALNGMSKIYSTTGKPLPPAVPGAVGWSGVLTPQTRRGELRFYGQDLVKGNELFRTFVLKPDIRDGIRFYEAHKSKGAASR